MVRIMLLCSAGMSTSLLVQAMKKAARERTLDCTIWASPESEARNMLDAVDVILLGPQVRFLRDRLQHAIGSRDIRLDVVDMASYGRMDGDAVLDQALELLLPR